MNENNNKFLIPTVPLKPEDIKPFNRVVPVPNPNIPKTEPLTMTRLIPNPSPVEESECSLDIIFSQADAPLANETLKRNTEDDPEALILSSQKSVTTPEGTRSSNQKQPPKPSLDTPREEFTEYIKFKHYQIFKKLGQGGQAKVVLARDEQLGRLVALKFLSGNDKEQIQRHLNESKVIANLNHDNIVKLFEAGEYEGNYYMALEYLQGRTFAQIIRDEKRLSEARAREIIRPIIKAISYLHSHNIIHRDIKPDNLIVTNEGVSKLTDFGIVKLLKNDCMSEEVAQSTISDLHKTLSLKTSHAIFGTIPYLPGERFLGEEASFSSDIYAIGIVLFQLIAGHHPLHELNSVAEFRKAALDFDTPMPSILSVCPNIDKRYAAIIDWCTKKRVSERCPNGGALFKAMEALSPENETKEMISGCPYPGIAHFQTSNAALFYGRLNETGSLVNRIRENSNSLVTGPSGNGKTSLVQAGAYYALKLSEPWEMVTVRPGQHPVESLASALRPMMSEFTSSVAADLRDQITLSDKLYDEPGRAGSIVLNYAYRYKKKILCVIDPLEELFTGSASKKERAAFMACVSNIAMDLTSPVRLVCCIRSDFLGALSEQESNFISSASIFQLNPLSEQGLKSALTQPLKHTEGNYSLEQGIVEDVLEHVKNGAQGGALPLVQFIALGLWENRDQLKKLLTMHSYKALGGVAGALSKHADGAIEKFSNKEKALVKTLLLRLVSQQRTRLIQPLEDLERIAPEIKRIVENLVKERLLIVHKNDSGEVNVELVHDSLVTNWTTLRRWLDESGEDEIFLDLVRGESLKWEARNRTKDLLLRGDLINDARHYLKKHSVPLPLQQKIFVEASIAEADRIARRKRKWTIAGGIFLSLVAVGAASAAVLINQAKHRETLQIEITKEALVKEKLAVTEAKHQTDIANKNLRVAQLKEAERAQAAKLAQEESERANAAADELLNKNRALLEAWSSAKRSEKKASEAREAAIRAANELQILLRQEKERVRILKNQLGSGIPEFL